MLALWVCSRSLLQRHFGPIVEETVDLRVERGLVLAVAVDGALDHARGLLLALLALGGGRFVHSSTGH